MRRLDATPYGHLVMLAQAVVKLACAEVAGTLYSRGVETITLPDDVLADADIWAGGLAHMDTRHTDVFLVGLVRHYVRGLAECECAGT